ncbi:MAG: methylmalonyl-CoA mutase family protein [Defluviitaleaceae bacterium]|nr:methylmalonyl-CoA mutase family protein [Defluviitaleaceae bacterium]
MSSHKPVPFDEFSIPTYDEWKEETIKALKGEDFDKRLFTKTFEGIVLKPIYTKEDITDSSQSLPGFGTYKRGTASLGYKEKKWHMAQQVEASKPSEVRDLVVEELEGGADAIRLELSPASKGLEGFCAACTCEELQGAHIFNNTDVKEALGGVINFENYGIYINTGPSPYPFVYLLDAAKACFKKAQGGHVGGSPLGVLAKNGTLPRDVPKIYEEMAEAVTFVKQNSPNIRTVVVDGQVYADGGADSVTEVACIMAEVSEYMSALMDKGLSADDAAKSIGITLSLSGSFFMEIAKIRGARVLFAQITRDFGASEDGQKASIHGITSKFNKSKYDLYVNALRLSTEAFSGVVGGLDALTVLPFDSVVGSSNAHSRRISRNQSVMMAEEFGLTYPVDPSGGSYYVEVLTGEFVDKAWAKFMEYEEAGGFYKALLAGIPQKAIAKTLADKKSRMATRVLRAVGVNMYANPNEKAPQNKCIGQSRECRVEKDQPKANADLDISPSSISSGFEAELSTISIFDKINDCHGGCAKKAECNPDCEAIKAVRLTEDFEAVRQKTEELGGVNLLLLNMGPVNQHKARSDFSAGFFETGGFTIKGDKMFATSEEAVNAVLERDYDICVICSTDDTYPDLVPEIAGGIKKAKPDTQVILAGMPAEEYKDKYFEAGLTDFIHMRSNCLETLQNIQSRIVREGGK